MKIVTAELRPYRLPLVTPLRTARGRVRHRQGFLLRLTTREGLVGHGEAAPLPGFSRESPGEASFGLGQALALLQAAEVPGRAAALPDFLDELLHEPLGPEAIPPTVAFAVELALLDLLAQRAGCPLAELLSPEARPAVPVSRLVAGPEDAARAVAEGLTSVKLKLGAGDPDADLARVGATREAVGAGVELRVDANQAFSAADARALLPALAARGVDEVEEPLRDPTPEGLAALRGLGVAIAADESLRTAADLRALVSAGAVDGVVLKPAFLGSVLGALALAREAAGAGLSLRVTSALDAAVGRRGALHLAAALPSAALRPCGLDTGGLLAEDLGAEAPRQGGAFLLSRSPGLGLVPAW